MKFKEHTLVITKEPFYIKHSINGEHTGLDIDGKLLSIEKEG